MQSVSAFAVGWRRYHPQKKNYPTVGVNTRRTETQRCRCKNAKLQLRVLNCSWTATTMLLLQTLFSTEIEVCRYLYTLSIAGCHPLGRGVNCLQLAFDFGGTKRQYERRINCKIYSSHSVRVSWALVSGTALLSPAPRYLSGHTNRNNTNIKHRNSSVQPRFTAVCLSVA